MPTFKIVDCNVHIKQNVEHVLSKKYNSLEVHSNLLNIASIVHLIESSAVINCQCVYYGMLQLQILHTLHNVLIVQFAHFEIQKSIILYFSIVHWILHLLCISLNRVQDKMSSCIEM